MRTLGYREGNHTHWGRLGEGEGRGSRARGGWGEITPGEMPDVDDGVMETANHYGMYVPMQQSRSMQDVHIYPRA